MMLCSLTLISYSCKKNDRPQAAAPVRVEVQVINAADSASSPYGASYSGTVASEEESLLSFSLPGTITNIYVKEGQKVAKGQVIARIKSESLNDEKNIAVAELEQVRDLYNRLKKLHDQKALPDVKWVEVQQKLKQAENAVAISNRAVSDATITAPISGYVTEKMADEGQSILPSQPVVRIVNTGSLQVSVSVPEESIGRFGKDATAKVTFDALGDLTVSGSLAHKDVVADPLTRAYNVKFNIPSADGKILPGMIANVAVEGLAPAVGGKTSGDYVVPSKAVLLSADNRQFVWVVKDGKAVRKNVTANEFRTSGVAIESGLAPGDTLIIAGMQKVSTGTPVTTTNSK